jgi:hypothetical protein
MHVLDYYRSDAETLEQEGNWRLYDAEIISAVDEFRSDQGLSIPSSGSSPPGLVDADTVERMWSELESAGEAAELRRVIRELTAVRR